MTLAKTCYASNIMQDLVKATHIATTKTVRIAMFQLFHYCIGRKLNVILKLKSSDAQRMNLTFFARSFVANLLSYIPAKYY